MERAGPNEASRSASPFRSAGPHPLAEQSMRHKAGETNGPTVDDPENVVVLHQVMEVFGRELSA